MKIFIKKVKINFNIEGTVSFTTPEGKQSMIVDGGVVEVKDNVIVLLAEKVVA
ncbi:hypothetical protein [Algoriphagus chordae]|uniref:hypothetical protein n=1 Tax=Algoriphagus chordae TaxID=237019 RepID=UPI002936EA9E|nr:hypothetical protein [Algoriphagus chordae]